MKVNPKLLALLAAASSLAAPAGAQAVAAAPSPIPPVAGGDRIVAALDACHADPVQSARYATFTAQMTQIKRGKSMAVRFDLFQRRPGDGYRAVTVPSPGFGVWRASDPNVAILRYSQEVANLPAPAAFRVVVSYRWLNARKHIIRRAHRTTPVCVLPDERPNLVAGLITERKGPDKSTTSYDLVVRNDGLGDPGSFMVGFSVGGQSLAPASVAGLAPGAHEVLSFVGPRCTQGQTLSATVDPGGAIDESTKADNVRSQTCQNPAP